MMLDMLEAAHRFLDASVIHVGGRNVTGATILTMVLVVLASFVISRVARSGIEGILRRRGLRHEGRWRVISRLLHYLFVSLGFAVALDTFGVNLGALFTAGAVFAVGFGFAMQTIAQNFVSGVILVIEGAIKPGDVLLVDGQIVRVVDMGIRSTLARSRGDEELIIPNSSIVQNTVKNFTLNDSLFRIRATVGVSYSSDMEAVRTALWKAADGIEGGADDKEAAVLLKSFGDSAVNWEVGIWVHDPFNAHHIESRLYDRIWWCLKEAGVTIAFPQLDVHLAQGVGQTA